MGIGISTLVADFVKVEQNIIFQTENGLVSSGPAAPAGKEVGPGIEVEKVLAATEAKILLPDVIGYFGEES